MQDDSGRADREREYAARVDDLIGMLAQSHALGRDIDLPMCVLGLSPGRPENRKVRDFVTRTLRIQGRDFDRAMHLESVRAQLGSIPNTAAEFVQAYAENRRITATYKGVLRTNEMPYIVNSDGTKEYISPNLWNSYEFKTLIRTNFRRTIGFAEFQQAVRARAAELRLDFPCVVINDATELWYADVCRNRLWRIMGDIDFADSQEVRDRGQQSLRRLAETCFLCADGVDFVIAVLNKFIWQVKRKINDMPIYDHLMPVILGGQGIGKSTMVRRMLSPVEELSLTTDFRQITDDRNISIWQNFVLFLDEMGFASKSDMDVVKNVITAETLTRRVMRTNTAQFVTQNATFIGTANTATITELLKDTSGLRRFASLLARDQLDQTVINEINWFEVWQSVDHEADDPMRPFRDLLTKRQEGERLKTKVEDWLDHLDEVIANNAEMRKPLRRFRSTELHTEFRLFEDQRYPGLTKTSNQAFISEMKHLASRPNAKFHFIQENSLILWGLCQNR